MQSEVKASYVFAVISGLLKLIQILTFFDKTTSLLRTTTFSNFLGTVSFLSFLAVIVINVKLSIDMSPVSAKFTLGTPILAGYTLFATCIMFFAQGLFDFFHHFVNFHEAGQAGLVAVNSVSSFFAATPYILPMATDVLCIASGISFYVIAMEHVKEEKKMHLAISLIPVIWATFSMLSIIIGITKVVSMQPFEIKVLVTVIVLLFLYYTSVWACGFEPKKKPLVLIFSRISFATLMICCVLPYSLSFLFGKRDFNMNVPYLAITGLALYGCIVSLQYLGAAVHFLKQNSRK